MVEDMNQVEVKTLQVGDVVSGVVTKVEEKQVLVELQGSKLDGILPISELSSLHVEKAGDAIEEGANIQVKVMKVEDEALILSKRAVDADKAWNDLEEKLES